MGNFKIEIEAVGGHGFSRETKEGERIPYESAHENDPDRLAREFVQSLATKGCNVVFAELTHWPESTPIVDNLATATRGPGDFTGKWEDDPVLRFFPATGDPLARMYRQFAYALVRRLPRTPERTLALRELLASYDNAKRGVV